MAASKITGKSEGKDGGSKAAAPRRPASQPAPRANPLWSAIALSAPTAGLDTLPRAPGRTIQRQADPDEPGEEDRGGVLIASDDATALLPGQMRKSEFLDEVQEAICGRIEPILAGAGQTSQNCAYLAAVFRFVRRRTAEYIDKTIRQFAPELARAAAAGDYVSRIVERVAESAAEWVRTGEITGLPPGVPSAEALRSGDLSGLLALQFKEQAGAAPNAANPAAVRAQLTHGQPLDGGAARLGAVFGADFSGVRVHTDSHAGDIARRLGSRAFTVGEDIAFAPGQYRPGSPAGDALLAHELAHVVQQRGALDKGAESGQGPVYEALEKDADTAAARAVVALWRGGAETVRPALGSGLRLSRCGAPEPMSEEEAAEYLATQHLRIVVIQETHDFLAGMRKSVAVAANESGTLDDHQVREGDELIQHGLEWPRLTSVVVDMPPPSGSGERYRRPSSPHPRTGNFTVHFMSVGTYHITAHVLLRPGTGALVRRSITVRRPEFERESEAAAPADLSSGARTVEQERLAWHLHRAEVRQQAATAGIIPQEVVDSWTDVSIAVLQRVALIEQGEPLEQTQTEIVTALDGFARAVRGAAGGSLGNMQAPWNSARGRAGSTTVPPIRSAIDALSRAFDEWLLTRIESEKSEEHELYKSLQYALQSEREVENLQRRSSVPPVRIPAIFHPKAAYLHQGLLPTEPMSTGRIVSVQLNLWLFREGEREWTLRDITNPEETFEYDVTNSDRDAAIDNLISQLSGDDERFPDGRLYIQPPGRPRRTIDVASSMDFLDWLAVIGLALIVAGAIMVTAGAATPGIVAAGGYFIAAGSAVAAGAAIIDTVQAYERGRLTATRLALNALQVIAAVATAGSATILARAARVGTLARLGANARYVFLNRSATAADIVTLMVMTGDAVAQIARLSGGSNQNAGMIASMLIGQLLIQGTLTVVSARDAFGGDLRANPHISIDDATDGSGLVLRQAVGAPPAPTLAGVAPEVPTGATHGLDVHPLTNVRPVQGGGTAGNLGPTRVEQILARMARAPRTRGATLARVTDRHYRMTIPRPGGAVTVDVHVASADTLPPSQVHRPTGGGPSQAGPARDSLTPPGVPGGNWRADITLDNRLPVANAEFVLGDELDEIAEILFARPAATPAEIAAQMDNSVFRRGAGANPPVTADDRATAGQLFEIHSKRVQLMRERTQLRARQNLSPAERDRLAQVEREITAHGDSLARLAGYMALDEDANMLLKIQLLRETAIEQNRMGRVPQAARREVMEEWDEFLGDLRLYPATTTLAAHGGAFGPGGVGPTAFTPESLAHVTYAEPHAPVPRTNEGQFRDDGVGGGHLDSSLMDLQNNHPEYGYYFHLEGTASSGGETYRRYTQYMWNGNGAPPARGTQGHPSGPPPLDPGWVRSVQPKTTVTNIGQFIEDGERALWQWVRHPTRQPRFFGQGATAGTSIGFTQKLPGGPRISGFFDFDPNAIAAQRFRIRTVFIDASWIP